MTGDDVATIREALLADRARTLKQAAALSSDVAAIVAATSDVATDDEHDPEGATIAYERARTSALVAELADHVADVDRALERLAAGSYPMCERCGAPIGAERLAARPVARTCIGCAARRDARPGPTYRVP